MLTSFDLVESLRVKYGADKPVSVYRVAKELEVGNGRVLNWHNCRNTPNQKESVRIANLLGLQPGYVLACMEAQRQSEPEIAEAWEAIAIQCA